MEIIETFFVLDFDRCLGNVDAGIIMLGEVIDELCEGNSQLLQSARSRVEASGASFSAFEYMKEYHPDVDLDNIEAAYIKRSQKSPDVFLESGVNEFVEYLRSNNYKFCIMSYGDVRWQNLKIEAAGFGDIPRIIVPNKQKSLHISQWFDHESGKYIIPSDCFGDNFSKIVSEVVLVDDKAVAFEDMSLNSRGYLVGKNDNRDVGLSNDLPSSVKRVVRINEIIDLEKSR